MKSNNLEKIKNLVNGNTPGDTATGQLDEINRRPPDDEARIKNDEGEHVDWEQVGQVLKDSEYRDASQWPDNFIDGDVECAKKDNCPISRAHLIHGLMNHQAGNVFNLHPMLHKDILPSGVTKGQQANMARSYNVCQGGICPDYIKQELKDQQQSGDRTNPNDPELPPRGTLDIDE